MLCFYVLFEMEFKMRIYMYYFRHNVETSTKLLLQFSRQEGFFADELLRTLYLR